MKFYHIKRDWDKSLAQQKKDILAAYENVTYIASDGHGMIVILADRERTEDHVPDQT